VLGEAIEVAALVHAYSLRKFSNQTPVFTGFCLLFQHPKFTSVLPCIADCRPATNCNSFGGALSRFPNRRCSGKTCRRFGFNGQWTRPMRLIRVRKSRVRR